jgi:hypothetical protein
MCLPIIGALVKFIGPQLKASCWDGEVPRYDMQGNPINPLSTSGGKFPATWPVIVVKMPEGGFTSNDTTEDPFDDDGTILIQVYGSSRSQVESLGLSIRALLKQASNWVAISKFMGGDSSNPNYVISMYLQRWCSIQEEGVRTAQGEFLYRADLDYKVDLHGALVSL